MKKQEKDDVKDTAAVDEEREAVSKNCPGRTAPGKAPDPPGDGFPFLTTARTLSAKLPRELRFALGVLTYL